MDRVTRKPIDAAAPEAAAYIFDMTAALGEMARNEGHHTLADLLRMAAAEAQSLVQVPQEKRRA